MEKIALVVFDVEGVVIPKNRFLLFSIGKNISILNVIKLITFGLLYEIGIIPLKSALKHIYNVSKGLKRDQLLEIFRKIPLMPDTQKTFKILRDQGVKTALISSGIPTIVVKDLASTLKADYAYGLELGIENGVLNGEISGEVIEQNGKLTVLNQILKKEGIASKNCAVVADDRNNVALFLSDTLKMGCNPDFVIRRKADVVLNGTLLEVVSLMRGIESNKRPSWNLLVRKTIHASGILIPVLSSWAGIHLVVGFISILSVIYFVSEMERFRGKNLLIISSLTHRAVTMAERYEFATAPLFFALGILLTLLLIPSPINNAAIAIFAIGDSTAALFGGIFGKTVFPFNKGKTLEGSIIGFAFAFLVGMLFLSPLQALVGAMVAMTIESLPLPVNDNLAIPLLTGAILSLMI